MVAYPAFALSVHDRTICHLLTVFTPADTWAPSTSLHRWASGAAQQRIQNAESSPAPCLFRRSEFGFEIDHSRTEMALSGCA